MTFGARALLAGALFCGVPLSTADQACTSVSPWEDGTGNGCSWYFANQDRCSVNTDGTEVGTGNITARVACCGCGGGKRPYDPEASSTYISAEDRENAENAKESVKKWCADGFVGELRSSRDKLAESVGEENIIITALEGYNTLTGDGQQEGSLMDTVQEQIMQPWVIQQTMAFMLAIAALIVWICCCWSGCPCSKRCCRCCFNKDRGAGCIPKACVCLLVLVAFLGVGITMLGTHSAYGSIEDGANNLICSASKLLDTALNGKGNATGGEFIGLMPVLEKFNSLDNQLKEGSPLLTELDDIMAETENIEDALVLVADTLKLMGSTLSLPGNVKPMIAGNTSFHKCLLCEQLGPEVTKVGEAVSEGVGNALFKARQQVRSQLTLSKRMDLQNTMGQATKPLVELKDQLSASLQDFAKTESGMNKTKAMVENIVYYSLFIIQICGMLLVLSGCCAAGRFAAKPRNADATTYNTGPSWCACSVWCCTHLLLLFVFIVSGLMNLIILPADGLCLLLQDLDGDMLHDIAGGLDFNMSGDQGEMMTSMVDVCWRGDTTGSGGSSNLLDIIFMREHNWTTGTGGEKVYLRQKLLDTVRAPVDAAFADIEKAQESGGISLANNKDFKNLLGLIANSSVAATLLPDFDEMQAVPWGGLVGFAADGNRLASGLATSSLCANFSMADAPQIPGIENFASQLKEIQPTVTSTQHACIEKVDCASLPMGEPKVACEAGNMLMDLKVQLYEGDQSSGGTEDIFRCDVFKWPKNGTFCDPINMAKNSTGQYNGDCLRYHVSDYTFTEQMPKPCTLTEFDLYVADYSTRLDLAVKRLDSVTSSTFATITQRLRKLVDEHLIDEIEEVSSGITCSFMPPTVQEVIDSLCYQTIAGLGTIADLYFLCGLFLILLALDMYFLFRFIQSNRVAQETGVLQDNQT